MHRWRTHSINARTADRVIRLAWTLADLEGVQTPGVDQMEVALKLRDGATLGEQFSQELVSA